MITIRITNVKEIVRSEKGRLLTGLATLLSIDLERRVEEEIIRELKKSFEEKQIEAEIFISPNPPKST